MDDTTTYRIKVQARLGSEWVSWFDGLEVIPLEDGSTLLVGPIADQAALHGVLTRIRDLALPLISLDIAARPERTQEE